MTVCNSFHKALFNAMSQVNIKASQHKNTVLKCDTVCIWVFNRIVSDLKFHVASLRFSVTPQEEIHRDRVLKPQCSLHRPSQILTATGMKNESQLIHSMQQKPSEARSHLAFQEIPCNLRNINVQQSATGPCPQPNERSLHILTIYIKIHFNIVIHLCQGLSKGFTFKVF